MPHFNCLQASRGEASMAMVAHGLKTAARVHTVALDVRRSGPGPAPWADDLSPVAAVNWGFDFASQLLERAGFGGTPEDVARLANMTPEQAVASLVDYRAIRNDHLAPFERSDVWDPSLRNFPVSRPDATHLAAKTGEAMGVRP